MADDDLIGAISLEDDKEVYEAVKRLALHSVDTLTELLDTAAPQQQINVLRIILPRLLGSLTRGSEDENAALREQVQAIYGKVLEAVGGEPDGDD